MNSKIKGVLKYITSRKEFHLTDTNRHVLYRKVREDEIKAMDKWLMEVENDLYISLTKPDGSSVIYQEVDDMGIFTWYNDTPDGKEDVKSYVFEIPTREGSLYINPSNGKCYWGERDYKGLKPIDEKKVRVYNYRKAIS